MCICLIHHSVINSEYSAGSWELVSEYLVPEYLSEC